MSQQGASATTTVMRLASEQALRGTLVVGGGGREGRRVCNYISGMWNPTPIPLSLPVGWAVRFPPISTKQKGVRMLTSTEKHVPGVMTSLLMSSPPISISHQLFRCRYSNSREWFQALLHFPALPPEHPRELARRLWQGPLGGGGGVGLYAPRLTFRYDHFAFWGSSIFTKITHHFVPCQSKPPRVGGFLTAVYNNKLRHPTNFFEVQIYRGGVGTCWGLELISA